jgi:predicted MFS family arabinose efflux permease
MSEPANGEVNPPTHPAAGADAGMTLRELLLLLVLAAVQFTHIVDFMIIMPLGPVFRHEMGLSPLQFGAVVSAYTISAGVAGLLAARFLDRFDRKTALLGLYAGFTAGTFLCAIAPDFPLLLAARTVTGAFGGVVAALVLAIVGDAFPDARRGTAMGVVMTAFSVASIAGVPLGLQLAEINGWRSTFTVLGGLGAAVLMLGAAVLPPLRGHLGRGRHRPVSTWAVLIHPNHLRAFALTCALVFGSFMLGPYLATFLEANVGVRQTELKYMYLCGGLATLITMTLFGRLADRFGKLRVFRILALVTLVPIMLMTNLPAGLALALVLTVTTVFMVTASGRMVPAMALITASSAPAYRGSFMSLNAAVQQMAAGLATSVAGLLLHENKGAAVTSTIGLLASPHGQGPLLGTCSLPLETSGPLVGFALVGVLASVATVLSVLLAGRLRKAAGGDLAPDSRVISAGPAHMAAPVHGANDESGSGRTRETKGHGQVRQSDLQNPGLEGPTVIVARRDRQSG